MLPKIKELTSTGKFVQVVVGQLTVWFSYENPIAFQVQGKPLIVSENQWNASTAYHLAELDPENKFRVPAQQFEQFYFEQTKAA